jgi:hypothetical protein
MMIGDRVALTEEHKSQFTVELRSVLDVLGTVQDVVYELQGRAIAEVRWDGETHGAHLVCQDKLDVISSEYPIEERTR